MPTFAARLRAEMTRRQWTQQELARRCGASQGAISHWLAGKRQPSLAVAAKLALALGCKLERLAG